MLGSVYFKRGALGRTWLALFALTIILGIIEVFILKGLFGGMSSIRNMNSISIMSGNSTTITMIENGFKIFSYLLIPYLWLVTYFRLTEKQV
jgi:hypothetical protein